MSAGHFIFIPAAMLVGVILGWILGSRAARDAFAAELKRREERAKKVLSLAGSAYLPTPNRCASTSGNPSLTIFACASSIGYLKRNNSTHRVTVSAIA